MNKRKQNYSTTRVSYRHQNFFLKLSYDFKNSSFYSFKTFAPTKFQNSRLMGTTLWVLTNERVSTTKKIYMNFGHSF